MRILVITAVLVAMTATVARAETFPVITNQTVLSECGDCHMAFPPQTLPKALWKKIMGDLSNHFGEDASLKPALVTEILAYHVENASDVSNVRAAQKWRSNRTFTRIIDAPRFIDKHRGCSDAVWNHKKVRSKANCLACHSTMQTNGSTDDNISFLPLTQRLQCGD